MSTTIPPILSTDPPNSPATAGYVKCDFCGCTLTKNGEVFRMSDTAREFRDQKEKLEKQITELNAAIDAKKAEITALNRRIEELTAPSPEPQSNRNRVGVL